MRSKHVGGIKSDGNMQTLDFKDDTEKDIYEFMNMDVYNKYKELPKFEYEKNNNSRHNIEHKPITTINNEVKYEGDWDVVSNERQGNGVQVWVDGSIYEGHFIKGKLHGKGRLIHADGDIYEGNFKNGKANGLGRYTHI